MLKSVYFNLEIFKKRLRMKEENILIVLHEMRREVTDILSLINLFMPLTITVSKLAESLGKDNKTIRKHLEGNFIKNVDYFQEVKKGKIEIPRETALKVVKYYVAKKAKYV